MAMAMRLVVMDAAGGCENGGCRGVERAVKMARACKLNGCEDK